MRPRLVVLFILLSLVAGCTAVARRDVPNAEIGAAPASPLLAAPLEPSSPTDAPAAPVTCAAEGEFLHCRDSWLELDFEYPAGWGTIAESNRRPGGYAGLAYEYAFRDGEPGVFAGGRSRDFSEGRGGMYTDQWGFGSKAEEEVCARSGAALCRPVQPGVVLMVLLPRAEHFCGEAMILTTTPRALVAVDLPRHPELHGFGFTASLLPPTGEAELQAQLGFAEAAGPRCTPEQQAAFDQHMAEIRQGLATAAAPAEIQARYNAVLHLAESLESPFLGAGSAGCAPGIPAGIPVVDAVVGAICAHDGAGLEALVRYSRSGCTYEMALGGPPACRPGETEGTLVDGIPVQGTEGVVVRRDEIAPVIAALLARDPTPLALYGHPQESYTEPGWPWAKYALVFAGGTPPLTTTLILDDAGIVRLYTVDTPLAAEPRVTGQPLLPADPRRAPAP